VIAPDGAANGSDGKKTIRRSFISTPLIQLHFGGHDAWPRIQALGQDAQREGLCLANRFVTRLPVNEHAWQLCDLRNPTAVIFLFDFYSVLNRLLPRKGSGKILGVAKNRL